MRKFKITKKQIETIYEATAVCNQEELKQWFPEAFKVNEKSKYYTIDFVLWLDENYYQHEIENNCYAASKAAFELEDTFTVKELLKKYKELLKKI